MAKKASLSVRLEEEGEETRSQLVQSARREGPGEVPPNRRRVTAAWNRVCDGPEQLGSWGPEAELTRAAPRVGSAQNVPKGPGAAPCGAAGSQSRCQGRGPGVHGSDGP